MDSTRERITRTLIYIAATLFQNINQSCPRTTKFKEFQL